MPVDPDAQNLLAMLKAAGRPPLTSLSPEEARAAYLAGRVLLQPDLPQVAELKDMSAPGPHGDVPLRFYRGATAPATNAPALLFAHGGGWVIGDRDSHDYVCRKLANDAACVVVSIDYRLGPEHKFPMAIEDSLAATQWLAKEASSLGVDPKRLAVGGDSAGGNISAVLALLARDGIAPAVVFQLLLYPAVDMNMDAPSFARIPDDYPLSPSVARWFRDHYMSDTKQHTDWRASPLHAESHHGVAPAFVLTARHDPLCDEGAAYAKKLEDAGVRVWQLDMNDQLHGFLTWGKMVRAADAALEMAAATLRYAFSTAK
ncbi:MAG: alpha/beta hydrolase [Beijerinckiaceae bacterium]